MATLSKNGEFPIFIFYKNASIDFENGQKSFISTLEIVNLSGKLIWRNKKVDFCSPVLSIKSYLLQTQELKAPL